MSWQKELIFHEKKVFWNIIQIIFKNVMKQHKYECD